MYADLICGIIEQAATDWRDLVKREKQDRTAYFYNYIEIRAFFNSQWCEQLMSGMSIKPTDILKRLERERLDALKRSNTKLK